MGFVADLKQSARNYLAAMVGPYGEPMNKPPRRPSRDEIVAVRVRDTWSSYPSSQLNPEKLAAIWTAADAGDIARQAELAAEIEEKEPEISSLLQTRKLAIQKLPWEIHPASDSNEDKQIAEFVKKNLTDLKLRKPIYDLADEIYKGFATQWVHWAVVDNKDWVTALEWLPQTRFTFRPLDYTPGARALMMPRLLTEAAPIYGQEVMPFSVLYHRSNSRSGLPQRAGLWRPLSWYALFKNFTIKDWLIFLDRFGIPIPKGTYTAGASADDKKILLQAISEFTSGMGVMISDTTMIDVIKAEGVTGNASLYQSGAEYFDKAFAKVILGQTATTQGTPGALGSEQARADVRDDIRDADAADLEDTINDQLIWAMVGFNFGFDRMLPKFKFIIEQPEDLKNTAEVDKILAKELGLPLGLSYFYSKYGRPQPVGDEPLIQVPAPFGGEGGLPPAFAALATKKKVTIPVGSQRVAIDA
ncbi:MAG: DUF935 domain-containing protein [Candidatus Binatia bacterium]